MPAFAPRPSMSPRIRKLLDTAITLAKDTSACRSVHTPPLADFWGTSLKFVAKMLSS